MTRYNLAVSNGSCQACGAPLSIYDRVCDCGALVHASTLAELRTRARIGQMSRDFEMATRAYQRALQLVPDDHPEHEALTRELEAVMDLARPKAGGGAGGSSDRSGLELRLLLAVAACLLLLLLWPLLSGSLGANGAGSPSGSGVDTSAGGPSRHPASGLLQPDP